MPPEWKKIAEDKNDDHPYHGREERKKWQVGSHTVSVTQHEKVLHIKVDNDYLMFTTPEKAFEYAIRKTSDD